MTMDEISEDAHDHLIVPRGSLNDARGYLIVPHGSVNDARGSLNDAHGHLNVPYDIHNLIRSSVT
jgi:hypothetical protein